MRFLLAIGSGLLPAHHRARWREESLALLLDVQGRRRWWYTADILLKLPVLAWHSHRGPGAGRPPAGAVLAGVGLLLSALAVVGALALPTVLGEDAAEGLFVLAPFALAPFITREAIRSRCGPLATAGLIVFAAFGPLTALGVLAAGRLAPAGLQPVVIIIGYCAIAGPAGWLATTSWLALRRRERPVLMHVCGLVAGGAFGIGIVALIWQMLSQGSPPVLVPALMMLSLLTFLATFPMWTVWAGIRLIMLPERPLAVRGG